MVELSVAYLWASRAILRVSRVLSPGLPGCALEGPSKCTPAQFNLTKWLYEEVLMPCGSRINRFFRNLLLPKCLGDQLEIFVSPLICRAFGSALGRTRTCDLLIHS